MRLEKRVFPNDEASRKHFSFLGLSSATYNWEGAKLRVVKIAFSPCDGFLRLVNCWYEVLGLVQTWVKTWYEKEVKLNIHPTVGYPLWGGLEENTPGRMGWGPGCWIYSGWEPSPLIHLSR